MYSMCTKGKRILGTECVVWRGHEEEWEEEEEGRVRGGGGG